MDGISSDAQYNSTDFPQEIFQILFALILIFGYPDGKEEMRKFLKNHMKEHGYENYESGVDTIIEKLYQPEDGTGSRRPC